MSRITGLERTQLCGAVCVILEEALRTRQTRPSAHDRPGRAYDKGLCVRQRVLCRDRLVQYLKKKKKKRPLDLERHMPEIHLCILIIEDCILYNLPDIKWDVLDDDIVE